MGADQVFQRAILTFGKPGRPQTTDLRVAGNIIYHFFNGTLGCRQNWKKEAADRTIKIDPDKRYRPREVAVIMGVHYDTAIRRMERMKGVTDDGTPTRVRSHKRGKRILTVTGRDLLVYLKSKTLR